MDELVTLSSLECVMMMMACHLLKRDLERKLSCCCPYDGQQTNEVNVV